MGGTKIKRGDQVIVIAGKEKGKKGKVLASFAEDGQVLVQSVNLQKRHTRPNRKSPQGGIVEVEGRLPLSNVMLVCPKCGQQVRVGTKVKDDGARIRACRKCQQEIEG